MEIFIDLQAMIKHLQYDTYEINYENIFGAYSDVQTNYFRTLGILKDNLVYSEPIAIAQLKKCINAIETHKEIDKLNSFGLDITINSLKALSDKDYKLDLKFQESKDVDYNIYVYRSEHFDIFTSDYFENLDKLFMCMNGEYILPNRHKLVLLVKNIEATDNANLSGIIKFELLCSGKSEKYKIDSNKPLRAYSGIIETFV